MALKAIADSLDGVEEGLHSLYEEKDGKFVLSLIQMEDHPDVAGLKASRDKVLAEKKAVSGELAELKEKYSVFPDDFDPEELETLRKFKEEVEAQEDDPKKKKAHEAEVQSVKKLHEEQLARIKKQMAEEKEKSDETINTLKGKINNLVVKDGLAAELAKNGVKKDAIKWVQATLERSVHVIEEDGELKAVMETDLGPQPLDEYIPKWVQSDDAKMFVEQPSGGGAPGGGGRGQLYTDNPWTGKDWNLTKQGQILKSDPNKAEAMAKAAGHKSLAEAQNRPDASAA